jgi:hypothetical protein
VGRDEAEVRDAADREGLPDGSRGDEDGEDGVAAPGLEWPNEWSRANSDPWLVEHQDEIRKMRPRVLALNFVNQRSMEEMAAQMQATVDAIAESSRYHGYEDPDAPVFTQYELAYAVDLRDESPSPLWLYNNSTLYPREKPATGQWGFDYEQLFSPEFAARYGIEDPDEPGQVLDLCELFVRGLVHEVWIYGDADVPDVGAAEILEWKPVYDDKLQRIPGMMNRCAGNGCFDLDDKIPETCTSTVRIAWMNNTRGPGCFLENLGHGFESIGAWNEKQIPYLSTYFVLFAGYRLDERYGLPFDSWYACDSGACLSYPTQTSVAYDIAGHQGVVDPYDPVCGNVHFVPNGRSHYDLASPFEVLSSCVSFRMYNGPAGEDVPATFTTGTFKAYEALASDCMGPFLVWWRQSFPGRDNKSWDKDGLPMRNWHVFTFY